MGALASAPAARRRASAARTIRRDLSGIDGPTAEALLEEYRPLIEGTVARYRNACRSTFYVMLPSDIRAIAETAVLEAWVTYQEGDARKGRGGLTVWIKRVVGWRVGENVQTRLTREPLQSERRSADEGDAELHEETGRSSRPLPSALQQPPTQEEVVHALQRIEWLYQRLGTLTPRQRVIITSVLGREPKVSIARRLGISKGRVSQEYRAAIETLRAHAVADGFELDLDPGSGSS